MTFRTPPRARHQIALAAFAAALAGCGGDDDKLSTFTYTVSYVAPPQGESAPAFINRQAFFGDDVRRDDALIYGQGTLKAGPRGAREYDFELFDADGSSRKRVTCAAADGGSQQYNFDVPLAAGGTYVLTVTLEGSCVEGS
jgi:hypothetical protein